LKSNLEALDQKLSQFNLSIEQKHIIRHVYYSYDEIVQDLQNEMFNNTYDLAKTFINSKNDLATIKQLQEQFSKFSYKQIELFLKVLLVLVPNNEKLFNLLTNINVNPVKVLLFNNIWSILQNNS
jgi:N-acetyl-beta-hexosaminidase